jgi:hypothetical protein
VETITFEHLKHKKIMFEQNVADGANLFVIIVAVIIGFVSALGYLDHRKTTKNQSKED